MKRLGRAVVVLLFAAALPALADPINIYGTGVGANGLPAANASVDPHYTITFGADPVFNGPEAYVANTPGIYPFSEWIPGTSTAQWIGPRDSLAYPFAAGNYVYTTTFDLTGQNPATAVLIGGWATDNAGLAVILNGVNLGLVTPNGSGATGLVPFTISSGFLTGVNTLQFVVYNDTGATGLLVDIRGTADPLSSQQPVSSVPEPGSLLLVSSGLAGILLRRAAR